MRLKRLQALVTLAIFVASLVAPVVVEAQDYEVDLSDKSATQIADITGRLTTKDALENQYTVAAQRQSDYNQQLSVLEQRQNESGHDDSWYAAVSAQVTQLKNNITQNDSILSRTRDQLGKLYKQLDVDRQTVQSSNDPAVKQELGTLMGVAGTTAVPIWARPTVQSVGGSIGQAAREVNMATVNARIPRYQSWAQSATANAAADNAALASIKPGVWVPQSNGANGAGELILRQHDVLPDGSTGGFTAGVKAVRTGIPAKVQTGDGTWVDNSEGLVNANDLASLQNAKLNISNQVSKLRYEAGGAVNQKVADTLNSRADALQQKQGELQKQIDTYNSENPSLGQQAKTLGTNAAKWAAFSVGITIGANVITQMAHNGWDPTKVDWGQATAQLKDPHFWGGVGGSFIGSYAGTLLASALPGGIFVKTLLSIGGAAIGWQAGSGQLGHTDWVGLGASTLGATVGMLIGTALGGPIGAFIGGIVGQLAADFILKKLRETFIKEVPSEVAGGAGDKQSYGDSQTPGYTADPGQATGPNGYTGSSPAQTGYGSSGTNVSGGDASQIAQQRNEVYQQMIQMQAQMKTDPSAFQQWVQLQQQYNQLTTQLHQMQGGANIQGGQ